MACAFPRVAGAFSRCVLVRSLMCLVTIVRSFDSALMRRACQGKRD